MKSIIDYLRNLAELLVYRILFLVVNVFIWLFILAGIFSRYMNIKIFYLNINIFSALILIVVFFLLKLLLIDKYCEWENKRLNSKKKVETINCKNFIKVGVKLFIPIFVWWILVYLLLADAVKNISEIFEPVVKLIEKPLSEVEDITTFDYGNVVSNFFDYLGSRPFSVLLLLIIFIPMFIFVYKAYEYIVVRQYVNLKAK